MTLADKFREEALVVVQKRVDELRTTLSFSDALLLPEARGEDVVIAGKEAQLTIFRQSDLPDLKGKVVVTVQLARHALGGMVSFHTEKGIVFDRQGATREATDQELLDSGG